MHKVCNIRDLGLRSKLPAKEMWAAYARDIECLMDMSLDGGPASIHSSSRELSREAA